MRTPPGWAKQLCARFGNVGATPKYRLIWAPDREEFCFGMKLKAYLHLGDRWVLETLKPWAEFGEWNAEAFGPKPPDGEYCHSHTIQYVEGRGKLAHTVYMSLEDFGMHTLELLLRCIDLGKLISPETMRAHRERMLAAEAEAEHQRFSDEWDDIQNIGLVGGPLGENAVSGIPGKPGSADIKIVTLDDFAPEAQKAMRCKPGSVKQVTL